MTPFAPLAVQTSRPLCEFYDVALLDLDGVVYVGENAVPTAPAALAKAASAGLRLAFVTNNASRTPASVAAHLTELEVPATAEQVVTSAQAAATLVAELVPVGAAVLVVGGEGLHAALRERALVPVLSADDEPMAVVQGFSPDVGWRQLTEAVLALRRDIPWIACNLDLTIPTPRGRAPGNGTLVNVVRAASGREPVVAGKPELPLHAEAVRRTGARNPLVVGDRLDTDIEGAVRAGTPSLLVLTGVTGARELLDAPVGMRPTFVSADLDGLLQSHETPVLQGATWSFRGWSARVEKSSVEVSGVGEPVDALRVACAAAWSIEPTGERVTVSAPGSARLPSGR